MIGASGDNGRSDVWLGGSRRGKNIKDSLEEVRDDLLMMFNGALEDPSLRRELGVVMGRVGVTRTEVEDRFLYYNQDLFAFGNEVYSSITTRCVLHVHNNIPGSWHADRHATLVELMRPYRFGSIVDIGYGVPGRYVRQALEDCSQVITLLDRYASARVFAAALLEEWHDDWRRNIRLGEFDLRDAAAIGRFDAYILFDSIEHAPDPSLSLSALANAAPMKSHFFLSIPVGPRIPVHSAAWRSEEEVLGWLGNQGLEVVARALVSPNADVDVFARTLPDPVFCVAVDAVKR